jgi:hypothetical protein
MLVSFQQCLTHYLSILHPSLFVNYSLISISATVLSFPALLLIHPSQNSLFVLLHPRLKLQLLVLQLKSVACFEMKVHPSHPNLRCLFKSKQSHFELQI